MRCRADQAVIWSPPRSFRRSISFKIIAVATLLAPRAWTQAATPGNGLAQHPFLYCGEWDYIHPQQTMYIVRGGKIAWSYSIPLDVVVDGKPNKEEFSDCTLLSNGDVLYSRRFGASEVTQDKKLVWNYDAAPGTEIHSVQPIGKDRVLLVQNGFPARLLLINKTTRKTEKDMVLRTGDMGVHMQFRRARMTRTGTFLVAHKDLDRAIEYDANGKEIWSVDAHQVWSAVRLKNGNTLVAGNRNSYVREVDPQGRTVWEILDNDLPGYPFANIQEVQRLSNGNTVICNWIAGNNNPSLWAGSWQVIEVTPEKKVVWALRQWDKPNLGPATSIQLLDEPGLPENQDHAR